jgi:hypothetical protein
MVCCRGAQRVPEGSTAKMIFEVGQFDWDSVKKKKFLVVPVQELNVE